MKRMKHPKDGSFHPSFILKLQTARFSTLEQLQGRDPHRKMRIDELYLPMGVLGIKNAEKQRKIVKNCFFLNFFS